MEDGNNYIQIAWPEALLENEYGFCVGYLDAADRLKPGRFA